MEGQKRPAARPMHRAVTWRLPLVFANYSVGFVLGAALLIFSALLLSKSAPHDRLIAPLILALIATSSLLLLKRGHIRQAMIFLLTGTWLVVSGVLLFFGGVHGTLTVAYPLIVIASGWLLGIRSALLSGTLSGLATLTLLIGERLGALPAPPAATSAELFTLIQLVCIIFATLLIVSLLKSYKARLHEVTDLSASLAQRSKEAQQSAADLARAQEVAHIGSWVLNCRSDEIMLSHETCRIFDLPHDTKSTRSRYLSLVHPDDRPLLTAAWRAALAGQPLANEHRISIRHKQHWIRLRGAIEFDNAGPPLRCVGSVQDITNLKLAEDELRIAATAFESQEGMIITNAARTILRVNQSFTRVTGYTSDEVVGRTPNILKSGRHNEAFYATMWSQINDSGAWAGEIWNRRKNGEVYPEWLTITAVRNEFGSVTHYVGTLTDITQRKASEDEIRHLAFYDALTRLPNRRLLLDRLQQALAASARSGRQGALLFLDLDNFKQLNDSRGHDKGDLLLQHVAHRLASCVREEDTAARFGGDEFVVMLGDLSTNSNDSAKQAETVARKILVTLREPYDLGDEHYRSTASIGITLFANHEATSFELLKQADRAMYEAKAAGRNTIVFFNPALHSTERDRTNLSN